MGQHKTSVVHLSLDGQFTQGMTPGEYVGRCTCQWRATESRPTYTWGEDDTIKHLADVERLRAGLKGAPSLARTRDYYEEMAAREDLDAADRRLWSQLAAELNQRLNDRGTDPDTQLALDF